MVSEHGSANVSSDNECGKLPLFQALKVLLSNYCARGGSSLSLYEASTRVLATSVTSCSPGTDTYNRAYLPSLVFYGPSQIVSLYMMSGAH
jgi:hypothetical protein